MVDLSSPDVIVSGADVSFIVNAKPALTTSKGIPVSGFVAPSFTTKPPYAASPVIKVIKPINIIAKPFLSNGSPFSVKPVIKVLKPNNLIASAFANSAPTIDNRPVLK